MKENHPYQQKQPVNDPEQAEKRAFDDAKRAAGIPQNEKILAAKIYTDKVVFIRSDGRKAAAPYHCPPQSPQTPQE